MIVTSGSEWQQGSGKRNYSVGLADSDGEQMVPDWESLTWSEKYKALQKAADKMVVLYMYKAEAFGKEMFNARMVDINNS